jgi:Asp-tRNA(Asn)/Glu-tRNA(Gln) amidotransferase A subunit family amidase
MPTALDRRDFLDRLAAFGAAGTLFPGVLWAKVAAGADITKETIAAAAEIAGVSFDDAQRTQMVDALKRQTAQLDALHKVALPNDVAPALVFDPFPPGRPTAAAARVGPVVATRVTPRAAPVDPESLAFATIPTLHAHLRARRVTSVQLTEMYLRRLERYDPVLKCVVTLTAERALRQAREADRQFAAGRITGPLQGIPWGAKDLLATKGYRTTWGTAPYREQVIDADATVVQRLDASGAVLVAKLTLGELAQGDQWFGGMTRNPWKVDQGSSGSSAGPGSATAAGLVGFSIGTETLGSISSPSTRNGVTGLRPTFGRVPRTGAMALSWSMDKIGPMCRAVEDCALVFAAIQGPDGFDRHAHAAPFTWDGTRGPDGLRVGVLRAAFDRPAAQNPLKAFDDAALDVLRRLPVTVVDVALPDLPYDAMRVILTAEAAAAFDDLTRSGRDKEMAQQGPGAWPNTFRTARFIPAVDYINANRVRALAIRAWDRLFQEVDVIACPTGGSSQLIATNLTGHPAVILPSGFRDDGTPVSFTFLGRLDAEADLLRVAHAWQRATDFHTRTPTLPG